MQESPKEQYKNLITSDDTKSILIHNSQIKNKEFILQKNKNSKRELYIDLEKFSIEQPVIAINRGNGNAGKYNFEFCYIDPEKYKNKLIAENHIYKIYDNGNNELEKLFRSLNDNRTLQFINNISCNGCITQSLIELIPVFF